MADQSNQPVNLPEPQEMVELTPENDIPFYEIEEFSEKCHIGNGTFGDCYKVFHHLTGDVVYKELRNRDYHNRADELRRREFDYSYQLNHHPFIVAFFGYVYENEKNNITGILLEYMVNGDLFKYILKPENASLSPEVLNTYAKQIAIALNFMHSRDIIHRDLKPNNILVSGDGKIVKIIDFGCSRNKQDGVPLTVLVGTIQYSAPEQLLGNGKYDNKVDVFSFAMTVYFLYFKKNPFTDLVNLQEMWDLRPSLSGLDSLNQEVKLNKRVKNLIERCWKTDPNERPTAQEIVEQFSVGNPSIPTLDWHWKKEDVLDPLQRLPSPTKANYEKTVKECVPRYERRDIIHAKKMPKQSPNGICYQAFHHLLGEFTYKEEKLEQLCSTSTFQVGKHTVTRDEFRLREFDNCFWLNHHPNIVPLYGYFFQADSSPTKPIGHGMEYMANSRTLFDYVPKFHTQRGPNPSKDDLDKFERHLNTFTKQIASALAFMHHRSIVHRDLKPDNILISHDEYIAKVADFGLSKRLIPKSSGPHTSSLGNYQFTAPELLNDSGKYSYNVDCYSFGMVLFYMFYNELPLLETKETRRSKLADEIRKVTDMTDSHFPVKKISVSVGKSQNQLYIDKMIERSIQIVPENRPSMTDNAKVAHTY